MGKEEVLNEILSGINQMKQLGIKQLDCPDINPWDFDELTTYIFRELDKLGYRLFSLDFVDNDGEFSQPTGLKITWE